MKFVEAIERSEYITVDGYSTRKTVLGAIREMGRYIAQHYDKVEGEGIIRDGVESLCANDPEMFKLGAVYCLEVEPVSCACKFNEDTDEMEYDEGNFYVVCRIAKR
jgi:hypothetical protein